MREKIIIGTRSSNLALWQTEYIKKRILAKYPFLAVELLHISTKGDRVLDTPLAKIGGKGLFTKEIESAMLDGSIDIAVHSLKDMPVLIPNGLIITAITERTQVGDAFVSEKYSSIRELPQGARVGTSSLRRKAQLLHFRPDLSIYDLRGNVNTRLKKMKEEDFDGIILAVAGLERLGFSSLIKEELPKLICLPAVGQGALAIEARKEDTELREMLAFLDDNNTRACTMAERAFLTAVQGGCQVPVGVYATSTGENMKIEAVIASLDGVKLYRDSLEGDINNGEELGYKLAKKLLEAGGREILQEIGIEV